MKGKRGDGDRGRGREIRRVGKGGKMGIEGGRRKGGRHTGRQRREGGWCYGEGKRG